MVSNGPPLPPLPPTMQPDIIKLYIDTVQYTVKRVGNYQNIFWVFVFKGTQLESFEATKRKL